MVQRTFDEMWWTHRRFGEHERCVTVGCSSSNWFQPLRYSPIFSSASYLDEQTADAWTNCFTAFSMQQWNVSDMVIPLPCTRTFFTVPRAQWKPEALALALLTLITCTWTDCVINSSNHHLNAFTYVSHLGIYLFIQLNNRKWWRCRPSNSSCFECERESRIKNLSRDWRAAGSKRIRRSRWGLTNSSLIKFCTRIQLSANFFFLFFFYHYDRINIIGRTKHHKWTYIQILWKAVKHSATNTSSDQEEAWLTIWVN